MGISDPLIGQTLKQNYYVDSKLGEGGPAIVYRGKDVLLGIPIAIKYLKPAEEGGLNDAERFLREARTQARLMHQNVVTIRAVIEEDSKYFIIMEYVEGKDLEQIIQESVQTPRISLENVQKIFSQVLSGLGYAHQQGVLHRDIKSANIMITPEHGVKIADFGIARAVNEPKLTKTGIIVGTPYYLAPEQILNKSPDHRIDIYSVGIMLYEALCGFTPFEGDDEPLALHEILRQHLTQEPPSLRSFGVEVPSILEDVLRKSIAKKPEERYQSCEELSEALKQAIEQCVDPSRTIATELNPDDFAEFLQDAEEAPSENTETPQNAAPSLPTEETTDAHELDPNEQTQQEDATPAASASPLALLAQDPEPHEQTKQDATTQPPLSKAFTNPSLQQKVQDAISKVNLANAKEAGERVKSYVDSQSRNALIIQSLALLLVLYGLYTLFSGGKKTPPAKAPLRQAPTHAQTGQQPPQTGQQPPQTGQQPRTGQNPSNKQPGNLGGPAPPPPPSPMGGPSPPPPPSPGANTGNQPPANNKGPQPPPAPGAPQPPPAPGAPQGSQAPPGQNTAAPSGITARQIGNSVMVYVPGGYFTQGSGDVRRPGHSYTPARKVYLSPFWIDQFEVTAKRYRACIKARRCRDIKVGFFIKKSIAFKTYSTRPMTNIRWTEAKRFCEWEGKRLPTEAEWEKAARGTDGRTYPWGEKLRCANTNYRGCRRRKIRPADAKYRAGGKSPYGAYDMAGNAAEWVSDCFSVKAYLELPLRDPHKTGNCLSRVLRGGSWRSKTWRLRTYIRGAEKWKARKDDIGFRCAKHAGGS